MSVDPVFIDPNRRSVAEHFITEQIAAHFGDSVPSPDQEADFLDQWLQQGVTTVPLMDGSEVTVAGPAPVPTAGAVRSRSAGRAQNGGTVKLSVFLAAFAVLAYFMVGKDLIQRRLPREAAKPAEVAASGDDGLPAPQATISLPEGLDAIVQSGDVRVRLVYPSTMEIVPNGGLASTTYVIVPVQVQVAEWPCPQPKDKSQAVACWAYGTVVNYLIGVPSNTTSQNLAQVLRDSGGRIVLRMSAGGTFTFEVESVEVVGRQETEVLQQNRFALTVPLLGGEGDRRTVITAVYVDDLGYLSAPVQMPDQLETGGVQLNISLGQAATAGPVSVLPTTLAGSGDHVKLVINVVNRSDRPILPANWAAKAILSDGTAVAAEATGTVDAASAAQVELVAVGDVSAWQLRVGTTIIQIVQ